jgi:hypothetical protein
MEGRSYNHAASERNCTFARINPPPKPSKDAMDIARSVGHCWLKTAWALEEGHEWAGALRAFWCTVGILLLKSEDVSFRIRRNGRNTLFGVVRKVA